MKIVTVYQLCNGIEVANAVNFEDGELLFDDKDEM